MGNVTVSRKVFDVVYNELEQFIQEEKPTGTMHLFSYAGGRFFGDDIPYFVVYDTIKELAAKYGLVHGWE